MRLKNCLEMPYFRVSSGFTIRFQGKVGYLLRWLFSLVFLVSATNASTVVVVLALAREADGFLRAWGFKCGVYVLVLRAGLAYMMRKRYCNFGYKSSARIISEIPLPPGTIGNTFSFWSVIKFINTNRSFMAKASVSAPSTSPGFSICIPTWP